MDEAQAKQLEAQIKEHYPHADVIFQWNGDAPYTFNLIVYWLHHVQVTIRNEQEWHACAFLFYPPVTVDRYLLSNGDELE